MKESVAYLTIMTRYLQSLYSVSDVRMPASVRHSNIEFVRAFGNHFQNLKFFEALETLENPWKFLSKLKKTLGKLYLEKFTCEMIHSVILFL